MSANGATGEHPPSWYLATARGLTTHPPLAGATTADVCVVGAGYTGLSAALHLAPTHRVAVLTKRGMSDGSSNWAQGGIAAVLDAAAQSIEKI